MNEPGGSETSVAGAVYRRLASGAAYTLLGRLLFGAAVILQNIVLSRLLGANEFGAVLLIQSISLPAAIVATMGLDVLAVRDLRDSRRLTNQYAPISYLTAGAILIALVSIPVGAALLLGLGALCYLPGAALSCSAFQEVASPLWPLVLLTALQLFLAGALRSLGKIVQATFLASVLATYLLLGVTLLLWWQGVDIGSRGVLALQALCFGAGVAASLVSALRTGDIRSGGAVRMAHFARSGPSIMLTQLLALLVTQSDVWVVSVASPAEHVAYYGVATRIAQLVSLPHLVLGGVLPPMIAEHLASGRRHELERMLRPVVLLAAVPSMGLALLLGVLGTQILSVGFGPAYATAAVPLTILAVGNVVNVLCGPCSQVLLLSHNQLTLNLITAASAILCIGGGVLASFLFGPVGVAVVFAVGLSLQGIAGTVAAARLTGVKSYAGLGGLLRR